MGFGRRGKTSFTVHRSEEVLPGDVRLSKQGSSASSDGEGSADGDRCLTFPPPSEQTRYSVHRERIQGRSVAHNQLTANANCRSLSFYACVSSGLVDELELLLLHVDA